MGRRRFFLLIVAMMFMQVSLQVNPTIFQPHEFDHRLSLLDKTVNYMVERPLQMNVDAVFGLTIAQAQLSSMLRHENANLLDQNKTAFILNLVNLTDNFRRSLLPNLSTNNYKANIMSRMMNQVQLWMREIPWKCAGALRGNVKRRRATSLKNESELLRLIFHGAPQEYGSNYCLWALIKSKLLDQCRISDECLRVLLWNDGTTGYPLTHRLLYVQTASALNCGGELRSLLPNLIGTYCSLILQDLIQLERGNFPGVSRDLAMEQIVLCGIEGFREFANDYYAQLVMSWAHPSGCFNSRGRTQRTRRSSDVTDFGCENHATGLGAASVSIFIRQYLENYNNNCN